MMINPFDKFLAERFNKSIPRDAEKFKLAKKKVKQNDKNVIVASQDIYVYFPARFEKAGLLNISDMTSVIGFVAMVCDSCWAVLSIPNMITMNPSSSTTVKINDELYYELHFEKGMNLIESTRVNKNSDLVYKIYNEFIAKPNKPLYLDYEDALMCLSKTGPLTGLSLEKTNIGIEIIVATTTRDSTNPKTMYRHSLNQRHMKFPLFLGLRNIQFGVTNITSALMGSYSDVGVDSMLAMGDKDNAKVEEYERLVRI